MRFQVQLTANHNEIRLIKSFIYLNYKKETPEGKAGDTSPQ